MGLVPAIPNLLVRASLEDGAVIDDAKSNSEISDNSFRIKSMIGMDSSFLNVAVIQKG
jgi:hypothetical protein